MRALCGVSLGVALVVGLVAAGPPAAQGGEQMFANGLLPPVVAPADNPQTEAKVQLGAQLYFETRLSQDNTVSCASCHDPDQGWADPRQVSEGVGHTKGGRNSPTVLNTAYNRFQFWDGRAGTLEEQALGPIQNPVEMAMTMPMALDRLKGLRGYTDQFRAVFNSEPTDQTVAWAIAAFERTVVSTNSAYDRFVLGDREALSPSGRRGLDLFRGKAHCMVCHSGPNFTDDRFHNLGVGYADGEFADVGRQKISGKMRDMGAFKTPGLRSVELTAPYMHDGLEPTLESVVDLYNRGGNRNPYLDPKMVPLNLSPREKADLVAFLKALTGEPLKIQRPVLPQ